MSRIFKLYWNRKTAYIFDMIFKDLIELKDNRLIEITTSTYKIEFIKFGSWHEYGMIYENKAKYINSYRVNFHPYYRWDSYRSKHFEEKEQGNAIYLFYQFIRDLCRYSDKQSHIFIKQKELKDNE